MDQHARSEKDTLTTTEITELECFTLALFSGGFIPKCFNLCSFGKNSARVKNKQNGEAWSEYGS